MTISTLLAQSSDAVGIFGVILLLIAYYLLSTEKMSAQSLQYQVLNLLGAIFILFSLMYHWNTASVLIEIAWIAISLVGIYGIRRKNHKKKTSTSNLYVLGGVNKTIPISKKVP